MTTVQIATLAERGITVVVRGMLLALFVIYLFAYALGGAIAGVLLALEDWRDEWRRA